MGIFKGLICLITILIITITSSSVIGAQNNERISEFRSNIVVNSDATINIQEEITYVFPDYRRGIEWTYPVTYSVFSLRRPTLFNLERVYYYPTQSPENIIEEMYEETVDTGWIRLRIGDPDVRIIGEYTYVIEYELKYTGISYFEDNDEVYLNIIGPGWSVPILNASANIQLPGEIIDSVCYAGLEGSVAQNCVINTINNTLNISTIDTLQPYEGLTFAVSLPKGAIEDTTREQTILAILANIGVLLPIPVGIFLFVFLRRKYRNKKLTVIPHYQPEKDMDAMSSGLLYSNKYKPSYISALLIELAVKGYVKIKSIGKRNYEFEYTGKDYSNLTEHQRTLLSKIFADSESVNIKKLDKFYETTQKVHVESEQYLRDIKAISISKTNAKSVLTGLSIALIFLSVFSFPFLVIFAAIGWSIGLLISSILLLIFSLLLIDIRSNEGNRKYHYLKGLRMYIDTAEKKRIEFHSNPKMFNKVFETLLPYAMIFGLERKWAKEFEDIYTQQPDWYVGDFTTFNSVYLASSIGRFNSSFSVKANPPSNYGSGYRKSGWSSGGSGFGGGSVGGGGGGSGGGSW
jgi:uncharacterized membrane protein YgcG